MARSDILQRVVSDLVLLHGLGVRLVVVLGTKPSVDARLARAGAPSRFVGGYRVTDGPALAAAVDAAGAARVLVEAAMSTALAVPSVRRHERASADAEFHYSPATRVVSGNYVTARRRGIVGGVDYGATGAVRFVQAPALAAQLAAGNVVLLTNLGFTSSGDALNLACYDVATHAAVELGADKLVVLTGADVASLRLPAWLPLDAASALVDAALGAGAGGVPGGGLAGAGGGGGAAAADAPSPRAASPSLPPDHPPPDHPPPPPTLRPPRWHPALDADTWAAARFPAALVAAATAARGGVNRAHLVDARVDGGLLLELYSRDGVGTMVSADFYEGIRVGEPRDADGVAALLAPLAADGVTRARPRHELEAALAAGQFFVVERDGTLLGCAQLADTGAAPDGTRVAELAAFCVAPAARGSGRGDSMLDYVEQAARERGVGRLVLLTTRTADWFVQRAFAAAGDAAASALLPAARRASIDPARGAKLFVKGIVALDGRAAAPAGKRIGF